MLLAAAARGGWEGAEEGGGRSARVGVRATVAARDFPRRAAPVSSRPRMAWSVCVCACVCARAHTRVRPPDCAKMTPRSAHCRRVSEGVRPPRLRQDGRQVGLGGMLRRCSRSNAQVMAVRWPSRVQYMNQAERRQTGLRNKQFEWLGRRGTYASAPFASFTLKSFPRGVGMTHNQRLRCAYAGLVSGIWASHCCCGGDVGAGVARNV